VVTATEALRRLHAGNRRFAANDRAGQSRLATRPAELLGGQEPFAIILGCSDSRVPAEIIFDQGLGDLFVIRVAGNIVAPSQIGSVEFAATRFGTRLVVVLGHSECGAIHATLEELQAPTEHRSRNLHSIVDFVRPSVESLIEEGHGNDPGTLVELAVRANVRASAEHMRHGSEILEELERDEGLLIVGAEYSLATGLVDFFDGVPETAAIQD
jgi:carbonic anhydrase